LDGGKNKKIATIPLSYISSINIKDLSRGLKKKARFLYFFIKNEIFMQKEHLVGNRETLHRWMKAQKKG
jgi:hypothetical protein